MKKFTLIIVLALFVQFTVTSQPCLPDGITFSTQAEIDSFQTNYPNCTEVEGYVEINGDDITNLNGLNVLTSIGGDLFIISNDALINLTGLDNVTSIGGSLVFWSNDALTNLTGLDNLTSIGGNLSINHNDSLTSLIGLGNLTFIGGAVSFSNNESLTSLSGLENLASIGAGLTIGPQLSIDFGNPSLISLTGLEGLSSIGGSLSISMNPLLSSITGLGNVTSIGGFISIKNNPSLTSLTGIENIDPGTITDLDIVGNSNLSTCEAQCLCDYLSNPNGIVNIYWNAPGCNNPAEVANACGFTLPCLPFGNYYFHTQAEIDNFQTDYPGCIELEGDVEILGNDITNLNGLNVLTSIGGNLFIGWSHIEPLINPLLTNLTGLEGLTAIGSGLTIYNNDSLATLIGLDNLTSIGGDLKVYGNGALTSLTGLGNLSSVGGSLSIGYREDEYYFGNDALTNLTGLDNVNYIAGDLFIGSNPSLSSCEVQSICDYIVNPNGTINIYNNAPGCNNQEEVETACTVGVEESSVVSRQSSVRVSPNPFSTSTTIECELNLPGTVRIIIYNQFGAQMEFIEQNQQQDLNKIIWTPNNLPNGIYYFRLQAGEQVATGKMVLIE